MIKYNKYKPSGVEWIGDIPEHWGKYRLKNISISVNGYSFKSDDFDREYDIPVIRIGDVGDIIDFEDCIKVKSKFLEEKKDFIVKKNDILIGLTGGTIGKSGRYHYETPSLLNQRVGLLRNKKEVLNGLLYHYVKSEVFIRYIFYDCYGGGQDNISMNDILNMVFPLPPSQEQLQIVQFLDEKTELIDRLISTKELKINLLKEQRITLINEVVTKGLNHNTKMKDSGVEWIGEIPEGWLIGKLKHNSELKISSVDKHIYEDEIQVIVCNYTDVYYNEYIKSNLEFRRGSCTQDEFTKFKLEKGDVIITKDSESPTDIGVPSFVSEELDNVVCGYHLSIIKPNSNKIIGQFLFRQLQTTRIRRYYEICSNGITRFGLGKSSVLETPLIIPPINEQLEIVKHIELKTKEIDDLVKLEQKKIDLLKQYRQSLISEVVTGKIKVTTDE